MPTDINRLLAQEAQAVSDIPQDNPYSEIIDLIHQQVHRQQGKLVLSGIGKAGEIARNIATTFCSTGTPAVFLHPVEAQHGDLGILQAGDVLFVVSNSGRTREILELLALARQLYPDIPTAGLTGHPESPLAKQLDWVLFTGNPTEVCPLHLTPTTSTTVMTVIGDILVVLMMERIGFTREDYGKRHHGGYLGQQSRI